ncbi:MAG: hypothetical protein H6622_09980 [Halobacteriovoraceae bacterium]|nr:hypothetical protein [Halobacteriovoraceae bacterium]
MNINNLPNINNFITEYLYYNPGFSGLFLRVTKDIDSHPNIEKIIKSIGFSGLRERMMACYLTYASNNKYPDHTNLSIVRGIEKNLEKFQNFSVDGHHRDYLLLFYFEMARYKSEKNHIYSGILPEVIDILKLMKVRTPYIDWIYIIIDHFVEYYGFNKLKDKINDGIKFNELWGDLTDRNRDEIIRNLLSYGFSISDTDFFCSLEI